MDAAMRCASFVWDTTGFAVQVLAAEIGQLTCSVFGCQRRSEGEIPDRLGTVLITGITGGIGRQLVRQVALRGGTVLALGRDEAAVHAVLREECGEQHRHAAFRCDLADLDSVQACCKALKERLAGGAALQAILCNAGVMMPPVQPRTVDGHDQALQVNYLGHMLLVLELGPSIVKHGTILLVSSVAHVAATDVLGMQTPGQSPASTAGAAACCPRSPAPRMTVAQTTRGSAPHASSWQVSPSAAYAESKLACLACVPALATLAAASPANPAVVAAHPGVVDTDLYRHMPQPLRWIEQALAPLLFRSPAQGAEAILHSAFVEARQRGRSTAYTAGGAPWSPAPGSLSPALVDRLWAFTLAALGRDAEQVRESWRAGTAS